MNVMSTTYKKLSVLFDLFFARRTSFYVAETALVYEKYV
jgi:hypothetical protein